MAQISSLRWWTKKIARGGFVVAGAILIPWRWFTGTRAYVLTYHRIGSTPRDPFCISVHDFRHQIRALSEQGRSVSLSDLEGFMRGEHELVNGACLVTIDDGMLSTYKEAIPILVEQGVAAVIFVSPSLIGRTIDGAEEAYMSWEQLREIAAMPGISVGSHAHTHRSLGAMSCDEVREEITISKQVLEEELGRPVTSFAYPFGTTGDFDDETDTLLREAGYSIAFNSIHGSIQSGMCSVSLPRVKIEGGEPQPMFELISRGATLPWRVVDRHLWRLQRSRVERS